MLTEGVLKNIDWFLLAKLTKLTKSSDGYFNQILTNSKLLKSVLILLCVMISDVAATQVETPYGLDEIANTFTEDTFILGYMESTYTFYILTKTEYWELRMVSKRNLVRNYYQRNDMALEAEIKDLTWVTTDSAAYLVAEGSGYMYEFTGNSIIRLENSYDQRSNDASTYFVHQNCIFNFSGYGYFQYPSFITRFDLKTKKQSSFLTTGGALVPPSQIRLLSLFNNVNNILYVWGGAKVAYTNSVSSIINNTNVLWKLDLDKKEWERVGAVNMPVSFTDNQYTDSFITFKSNKELFSILGSKLYVFDIFKNKISTYKISEEFNLNVDANIQPAYSPSHKALLLSSIPYPNQNIRRIRFVTLSNYKSELESETRLLKTHIKTIIKYGTLFILFLGLAYLAYYLYKNYYIYRNKLIILRGAKTIKFNTKLITVLDNEETELVFWIALSEDYVSTTYIMDRPSDGSQSYESMKKRKLSTMKSIEVKLGAFSQIKKPVFKEKKSTEDLRLKEYKLNNDWIIIQD